MTDRPYIPTAHEAAESQLRRHCPKSGDVEVTANVYPILHDAFEAISHDGGAAAGHQSYFVPAEWAAQLPLIEAVLSAMDAEHRAGGFVLGEASEIEALVQSRPELKPAHDLLNAFFEDFAEEAATDGDSDQAAAQPAADYVTQVSARDAAVAYRARIACDILEGFTDGIDGDRLGELARWTTSGRALDDAALLRAFAAPWIAASEEAGWEGDPEAEARKDIDRHTLAARIYGVNSFTPDQLATTFARHNELKAAAANALEVASSHIQHMAAWISKTNASDTPLHGYSFEALGEDKWIIDQALAALKSPVTKEGVAS